MPNLCTTNHSFPSPLPKGSKTPFVKFGCWVKNFAKLACLDLLIIKSVEELLL